MDIIYMDKLVFEIIPRNIDIHNNSRGGSMHGGSIQEGSMHVGEGGEPKQRGITQG